MRDLHGQSEHPVYELNVGVFAEEQGFETVVIRNRDGTDGKIVILRR